MIDNVLNNFAIVDLKDRNELLNLKKKLIIEESRFGGNRPLEYSHIFYNLILEISARC